MEKSFGFGFEEMGLVEESRVFWGLGSLGSLRVHLLIILVLVSSSFASFFGRIWFFWRTSWFARSWALCVCFLACVFVPRREAGHGCYKKIELWCGSLLMSNLWLQCENGNMSLDRFLLSMKMVLPCFMISALVSKGQKKTIG